MKQVYGNKLLIRFQSWGGRAVNGKSEFWVWRYGIALVCVALAFGIRCLLNPLLGLHAPYVLFVPAIILAAWRGGIGPAFVAIVATFLLTDYFFLASETPWNPFRFPNVPAVFTYVFSAIFVIGLMNAFRRERECMLSKAELLRLESEQRQRIEAQLREKEERLRAILENSPAIIFLKDVEGRYLLSNREFEKVTRKRSQDVIGKTDREIFPQAQADVFRDNDLEVLAKGAPIEFEEAALQEDGMHVSIVHKFPLRDSSGKVYAVGGIVTDVTQRKRAEEDLRRSEEWLRTTTENANIHLWSWDVVHDVLECPLIRENFGWSDKNMGLQTFLDYVHPEDRVWVKQEVENSLREGGVFDLEHRTVGRDNLVHWQYSKGRPICVGGRAVRLEGISMDITERKRAEEALRRSEALLRRTTESARIGLWSWDITCDTLEWNSVEYRQFGLSPGTKINLQTFVNGVHPEDRERVNAAVGKCLKENCELDLEHRILLPDGSVRWNQCKGRPCYVEGRAVQLSGMSLDITERKAIEEGLCQQAELLDLAQVLVFDLNDKILFWNKGAEKLYGWTKEEAVGKNCHDLLRTEFQEPLDQIKRSLFEKSFWEGELTHFRKDGEKICVASSWALHKDAQNRPLAILESNNNITAVKKAEAALQETKDALEQRVERRTTQLQKSIKDMETFCYTIAHDLRAPLRSISGFSHSLSKDYAPQLDAAGHEYCQRINAAASRMNQLISDLLVYGRLTHSKLPMKPIDLTAEVEKVLIHAAPQIEERHAEVEVDKPLPEVFGDAPVLDQILENLITNAVKFVPPERQPHVHIFAEHHCNNVRLCIEDNGIGIPPEYWQKIFRPFERLHAAAPYPGTGIGLAIVQRGIEKMGGHVGVESIPGQGSRFWVELREDPERPPERAFP